jgi:hypothetical protein
VIAAQSSAALHLPQKTDLDFGRLSRSNPPESQPPGKPPDGTGESKVNEPAPPPPALASAPPGAEDEVKLLVWDEEPEPASPTGTAFCSKKAPKTGTTTEMFSTATTGGGGSGAGGGASSKPEKEIVPKPGRVSGELLTGTAAHEELIGAATRIEKLIESEES